MDDGDATLPAVPGPTKLVTTLPEGLAGFTTDQLRLDPMDLRIVHAIRGKNDVGRPGQLRLGRDAFDEFPAVFLRAHPLRVLLEGPVERPKAVCTSIDGLTPHVSVEHPKSPYCIGCAYAQWEDGPGGKRIQPPCSEGVAFLGIRPDHDDVPFRFICKKSANRRARQFLNDLANEPDLHAIAQCRVKISTEEVRNGGAIWYLPVFTVVERVDYHRYADAAKAAADYWYIPQTESAELPPAEDQTPAGTWDVPV